MNLSFPHHHSVGGHLSHPLIKDLRPVPIAPVSVSREFLAKAIRTGSSLRGLSRVLNVSVHHVYQLCVHYGLAIGKRLPTDLAATIRQQAAEGQSPVQLAQRYRISLYRVQAMLHHPPAAMAGRMRPAGERTVKARHRRTAAPVRWRRSARPAA